MTSFTLLVLFGCLHVCTTYADKTRYTNEWIVEVKGGPEVADEIAQRHGFKNLGKVTIICKMIIVAIIATLRYIVVQIVGHNNLNTEQVVYCPI